MTPTDKIRRQWVIAVLEGRMATAAFLTPDLPPVNRTNLIHPPAKGEGRNYWTVAGEIEAR